jgi:regulator of sigma E protease
VNIQIPGNFIENFNNKEAALNFIAPRIPAKVGQVSEVVELPNQVKIASVAKRAGLKEGDQFIEVDGQPVFYHDEVVKLIKSGPRDSIAFKIKRGEEVLAFKEDFKGQTAVGFYPKGLDRSELAFINYGFGESVSLGTERAFGVIFVQLKAFKKIFSGEMSLKRSLSGPIGMAQAFGTEWDWERFWRMTGLLSMVLAFMNLLPIPALDGGYVVFLLYEMISGREPSEKFFETALKIGMAILLVLMVFVFYNDIAKLITGG